MIRVKSLWGKPVWVNPFLFVMVQVVDHEKNGLPFGNALALELDVFSEDDRRGDSGGRIDSQAFLLAEVQVLEVFKGLEAQQALPILVGEIEKGISLEFVLHFLSESLKY